jgi:tetratricopeptide (TPR) repeat protein
LLGAYLVDVAEGDVRRRHEIGPLEEEAHFGGHARRVMQAYEASRGMAGGNQARVLRHTALALRALGRMQQATSLLQLALEKRVGRQSWSGAAKVAGNLSEVLQARGDLADALRYAEKGVDYADREEDDVLWRVARRATLADVLLQLGRVEEAEARLEEARQVVVARKSSARVLFAIQGFTYFSSMLDKGSGPEIRTRVEETLGEDTSRGWILETALDHLSLGRSHLDDVRRGAGGDLSAAVANIEEGVGGLRRAGRQDYLPVGLLARAALHVYARAFDLARRDLDEALALATRCGFRLHEADAHLGAARLSIAEGDPAAARARLALARKIVDSTGYHRRDGELAELEAACHGASSKGGPL